MGFFAFMGICPARRAPFSAASNRRRISCWLYCPESFAMRDIPLPRGLPPMSKKEERAFKQRIKQQIKPKSVALIDQAKNFYWAVGMGISHWASMETRLVQIAARLLKTSEVK